MSNFRCTELSARRGSKPNYVICLKLRRAMKLPATIIVSIPIVSFCFRVTTARDINMYLQQEGFFLLQELSSREEELAKLQHANENQAEVLKKREKELHEREMNLLEREINIIIQVGRPNYRAQEFELSIDFHDMARKSDGSSRFPCFESPEVCIHFCISARSARFYAVDLQTYPIFVN